MNGLKGHAEDLVFGSVFSYREMAQTGESCRARVVYRDPEVCAVRYGRIVFVTTRDLVIRHMVSEDVFLRSQREVLRDARFATVGYAP